MKITDVRLIVHENALFLIIQNKDLELLFCAF